MIVHYLFALLLLALWLQPSLSIAAEEPLSVSAPMPANVPADYPEDFSQPDTLAQAPDYTDAFGEDEVQSAPGQPTAVDLFAPLDKPSTVPAPVPATSP